jgi:hypothetical protein
MNNPKEKAEELFITYVNKGMNQIKPVINRVIRKEMAKQCALIAVDELIESTLPSCEFGGKFNNNTIEYWIEVKNELEKL